jgi:hypothetical protein
MSHQVYMRRYDNLSRSSLTTLQLVSIGSIKISTDEDYRRYQDFQPQALKAEHITEEQVAKLIDDDEEDEERPRVFAIQADEDDEDNPLGVSSSNTIVQPTIHPIRIIVDKITVKIGHLIYDLDLVN